MTQGILPSKRTLAWAEQSTRTGRQPYDLFRDGISNQCVLLRSAISSKCYENWYRLYIM